jgi:RNA polymerase sigma-70 factor (ECF subfamily)
MIPQSQVARFPEPGNLVAEGAPRPEREPAREDVGSDPGGLAAVYDQYGAALHRLLCAMLGSRADAEDALQEVFARLAEGRGAQVKDLKAYLFAAARNEALSVLRRRRREALFTAYLPMRVRPARRVEDAVQDAGLLALLQQLPPEQREVVALKVFEQMTFAEIALLVKAPPNTVAARYRYGIQRLRRWWEEEDSNGT